MTADNAPTIDVIIPAQNERRSIGRCLAALAQQDYPRSLIKVYVVDGGSTDGTRYLTRKHNATLLTLRTGTIAAARNMGIRNGNGAIIAFLDAHSIPEPDWLRQMVTYLKETGNAACQGSINFKFNNGRLRNLADKYSLTPAMQEERCLSGRWTAYPFICTGNAACTRIAIEDIGLFDERLDRTEDLDLSWRLVLAGYSLGYCPQSKVLHVDDDNLWTHALKHFREGKTLASIAHKYKLLGKHSPELTMPTNENSLNGKLASLVAKAGYKIGKLKQKIWLVDLPAPTQIAVRAQFRPKFSWTSELIYSLSDKIIFWRSGENEFILVDTETNSRIVFFESSAVIFEQLIKGASRLAVIDKLAFIYNVDSKIIEPDIDEFVRDLVAQKILLPAAFDG